MPLFFYTNGHGKREQITPEAVSRALPHSYHCLTIATQQLITLHRDCIETVYTPEEIAAQKEKMRQLKEAEIENSYGNLPPLV
jgi:hypothetical protein